MSDQHSHLSRIEIVAKSMAQGISPVEIANRLGATLSEVYMLTKTIEYRELHSLYRWNKQTERTNKTEEIFNLGLEALRDVLSGKRELGDARAYVDSIKLAVTIPEIEQKCKTLDIEPDLLDTTHKRPNQSHAEYFLEKVLRKK